MPYQLDFQMTDRIIYLNLVGEVSVSEFLEIDRQINHTITRQSESIALIVDASKAVIQPYGIEAIKRTQTYLQSRWIAQLLVTGESKITRLAMMLLFNACRPKLHFCKDRGRALQLLDIMSR
jgi:hypothetical protein